MADAEEDEAKVETDEETKEEQYMSYTVLQITTNIRIREDICY